MVAEHPDLLVRRFVNPKFTSNTFVVHDADLCHGVVFDIGEYSEVRDLINSIKNVEALFLTHSHYDHIYYLNEFAADNPDVNIYASVYTIKGLRSSRLNLSYYHDDPITFNGAVDNCFDAKAIHLDSGVVICPYTTPGHNPGCVSFKVANLLFTGDSYLPEFKVVTKLKGGSKESNRESLRKIQRLTNDDTIICPGHGHMVRLTDEQWNLITT